jgi:O-antigen/teichoic acid export membrane protein
LSQAPRASSPRRPASSFLADFATTSVAQIVSVGLNALSLAVISRRLGGVDLGLYTLERRGMGLLQPIVLLGLSVATPRFIALSLKDHRDQGRQYSVSGTRTVAVLALLLAAVMTLFPGVVGSIFFGSAEATELARALAIFVLATALFQITYSVSRGHLHLGRANLAEVLVVGAFPLVLAAFGPKDVVAFMWLLNLGILGVAAVLALSEHDLRSGLLTLPERSLRQTRSQLLAYGAARTPGDIAVVALFALAPIAVVHAGSTTDAGYTSIVVSALSFVSVAAVPVGLTLLPRVAVDLSRESGIPHEKYVRLGEATVDVAIGLAALLFLTAPLVSEFWIPDAPAQVITGMELAALGIPGYVFYLIFRAYLDAVDRRPLSSAATIAGLVALLVLLAVLLASHVFAPTVAAAIALMVALNLAGVVTYVLVRRRIPGFIEFGFLIPPALALGATIGAGILVREMPLEVIAIVTAGAAIAWGTVAVFWRRMWVAELRIRLGGRFGR